MRTGNFIPARRLHSAVFVLICVVLLLSVAALATRAPHAVPQAPCPTQADCDRLKQISDTAAAAAAAAKAVADQAQADREKDLSDASRLDREAEFPSSPLTKDMRTSERLELGAAKHAQAKALRAKLPNAQQNAKAAADAAAAALKDYNDCLEKLKNCPKPVTPQASATTTTTPAVAANGGRRNEEGTATRAECLDGTTSSAVLPLKLEYKLELGLKYNWYEDPKSQPYAAKDVYPVRPCRIDPTGSLELGVPFNRLRPFGTGLTLKDGIPTWVVPNTPIFPDRPRQTGDVETPVQRIRDIVAPRYTYIRPVIYRDYGPQYMDYFGWRIPKYRCQNDFPYSLQKMMGIATAQCQPSKSPVVVAGRRDPGDARPRLQNVSFRTETANFADPAAPFLQDQPVQGRGGRRSRTMPAEGYSYSIVSNGKSTGEAFQLQLSDPTGKVKSVEMPEGTVLEAIRPGVTQPVTAHGGANLIKQPLNGFCLEFAKHPPTEGTMYRIADEATQEKYRPLSFLSGAGGQMKQKNAFHPDSDPNAYFDAILQYALWTKLEGWNQDQFTQHFVQRTKENADALHVKWTNEMENALRAAAPGRWNDISEMLSESQDLEKNSGQGRGGRRGGGGRGGRRGAARGDQ